MILNKNYDENYLIVMSEYFSNLRKESRRTIEEVANAIGLKPSTFYHYEHGLRYMPMSVVINLSNYYGKSYVDVMMYVDQEATARTLRMESHNEQV